AWLHRNDPPWTADALAPVPRWTRTTTAPPARQHPCIRRTRAQHDAAAQAASVLHHLRPDAPPGVPRREHHGDDPARSDTGASGHRECYRPGKVLHHARFAKTNAPWHLARTMTAHSGHGHEE